MSSNLQPGNASRAAIEVNRYTLVIIGVLSSLGALSTDIYLPAFPSITHSLSTSQAEVQLSLSVFLLGFTAGQLFYGPLSDRFGRKPVILLGLLAYGFASIACALSVNIGQLQVARLIQGLAGASGSLLARALVRDLFHGEALTRAMSWQMLILTASPILAPTIGSLMLSWFGWRSIFWTLAVFSLLWILLISMWVPETKPPEHRLSLQPNAIAKAFFNILSHPQGMGYAMASGLAFGAMFIYIAGTPFIYSELYGVSPQGYAGLFALNVVTMASGSFLSAKLAYRVRRNTMLNILLVVMVLSTVLLSFNAVTGWGGLWGLVIPLMGFQGTLGAMAANCIAAMLQYFPKIAGTASSVFGFFQFGMGSVAGALMAWLYNGKAAPMAFLMLGFVFCSLASLLLLARRPVRSP